MKNAVKVIFHVDLNQFFCTVASIINPRLVGKPFAIGRENSLKGVISTASYEARKYKIHAGMSLIEAYNRLPSLIVVSVNYDVYVEYSNKFFNIAKRYTDKLVIGSIDECYLDVTNETLNSNIHPLDYASEIQKTVFEELKLPCSIGIAPTVFLAKMASDLKKPMGISILRKRDVSNILFKLPVEDIYGCGKKTCAKLRLANINTIGDFCNVNNSKVIISLMGLNNYNGFLDHLYGRSSDIVESRKSKHESISTSITYDQVIDNDEKLLIEIFKMSNKLVFELKNNNMETKTVGITLRDSNFKTKTRSISIDYTNNETLINYYLENLVDENYNFEKLRLIGVTFSNLRKIEVEQVVVTLFNVNDVYKKEEAIDNLIKEYKHRFGSKSLFKYKEKKK